MSKKKKILIISSIVVVVLIAGAVFVYLTWPGPVDVGSNDRYISSALAQARGVMGVLKTYEGHYDNFHCQQEDMVPLCEKVDKNYGQEDGKEPVIVHDAPVNSQAACIYSPLNAKDEYWYCADSKGRAGTTDIDPGTSGYCVDGESAVCPPGEEGLSKIPEEGTVEGQMPEEKIEPLVGDIPEEIRVAYLQGGDVWSLDVKQKKAQKVLDLPEEIEEFEIFRDGGKMVYAVERQNSSEVWEYSLLSGLKVKLLAEPNIYYDMVNPSPDGTKLAYVKKVYHPTEELFLEQNIWITDLTTGQSFKLVDSGRTVEDAKAIYTAELCGFVASDDLIKLDKWLPDGKYIVYRKTFDYECSGAWAPYIKIISLDGKEDFFSEEFLEENKFDALGKTYDWAPTNIIWPDGYAENQRYLLEQSGPIPLFNRKVAIVEKREVKLVVTEESNRVTDSDGQHVRGPFDFNGTYIVWKEWINFYPVDPDKGISSSNIWVADLVGNQKQLTSSEYFNDEKPFFLDDEWIIFERQERTDMTESFYEKKKDLYVMNIDGTGIEKITEDIEWANIRVYYESR